MARPLGCRSITELVASTDLPTDMASRQSAVLDATGVPDVTDRLRRTDALPP